MPRKYFFPHIFKDRKEILTVSIWTTNRLNVHWHCLNVKNQIWEETRRSYRKGIQISLIGWYFEPFPPVEWVHCASLFCFFFCFYSNGTDRIFWWPRWHSALLCHVCGYFVFLIVVVFGCALILPNEMSSVKRCL